MAERTGNSELSGKVALVTGSSRGIGRAVALELARRGASVAVHYFRDREAAAKVCADIHAMGGCAVAFRAHMGKRPEIESLFQELPAKLGGLDILVSSAASAVFRPAMELDEQAWDWTMNVSAKAVLWCAQLAAPLMRARGGGTMVHLGSLGAHRALPRYAMAGTAKAALEALTRYLAVELAPQGIRVNAVVPGVIRAPGEQDVWDQYPGQEAILQDVQHRTPLGRFPSREEVAKVVAFLAGPEASAIVGQTMVVDGGFSIHL